MNASDFLIDAALLQAIQYRIETRRIFHLAELLEGIQRFSDVRAAPVELSQIVAHGDGCRQQLLRTNQAPLRLRYQMGLEEQDAHGPVKLLVERPATQGIFELSKSLGEPGIAKIGHCKQR